MGRGKERERAGQLQTLVHFPPREMDSHAALDTPEGLNCALILKLGVVQLRCPGQCVMDLVSQL